MLGGLIGYSKNDILIFLLGDIHGNHLAATKICKKAITAIGRAPDLILQVGDFNPSEKEIDLLFVSTPLKYRVLSDFKKYASKYPAEVIFIGGNHEPVNILNAMPAGGRICENIYYIGRANVVERFGLRIAGLSGVYSEVHFSMPLPKELKPDGRNKKDFVYIREADIDALLSVKKPVDILLMHDWPRKLLEKVSWPYGSKGFRREGYEEGELVIDHLKPKVCILGHMHFPSVFYFGDMLCISLCEVMDQRYSVEEKLGIIHVCNGQFQQIQWKTEE